MKKIIFLLCVPAVLSTLLMISTETALTTTQEYDNDTCLGCHSPDVAEGETAVDPESFVEGPHEGMDCISCHTAAAEVEDIFDHGPLGEASCEDCHAEVLESISQSAHTLRKFKENQPTCVSCHGGGHEIRYSSDPQSPSYKLNQPTTCGPCHRPELSDNYMKSIHGQLLQAGETNGPACMTCHSSFRERIDTSNVAEIDVVAINARGDIDPHLVKVADLVRNPSFKQDLLFKCSYCHEKEWEEYKFSIHGVALLERGVQESPNCASCHSSHQILPPSDPDSAVFATKIVQDCEACHADTKLIRRFGIKSDAVASYEESYHGRATGFGDTQVANCASCHKNHDIFRAADERSSVNPKNLKATCGNCHPGASEGFIQGRIHVAASGEENYWANLVASIYFWMIVVVISGMVIHNALDFSRKLIIKNRKMRTRSTVVRMTGLERFLHATLAISFLMLVYTGFALMFPDAWWVTPLNLFGDSEQVRATTHRICGVILTLVAIHHLWYLFFHKRGREQRRAFMPRIKDIRDVADNIAFYLGKRKERPKFGRFSYMEKAEYWALVWGTAVMVVTGFVLWFQEIALMFMPKWLWDVFNVVHLYEAILAALAIVVWHFYFVMINPDEAPLSLTFFNGLMTMEELAKAHPDEYEAIMKKQNGQNKE